MYIVHIYNLFVPFILVIHLSILTEGRRPGRWGWKWIRRAEPSWGGSSSHCHLLAQQHRPEAEGEPGARCVVLCFSSISRLVKFDNFLWDVMIDTK